MGLNQNQNGEKIKTSTDEERERQIRINRNLARFLADQTAQQRVSKRRQHQNNNVVPSTDVSINKPIQHNKDQNRCVHYGMKLAEEYNQIRRNGDHSSLNKNVYQETQNMNVPNVFPNQRPLMKQASLNPRDEERRQNLINNNISNHAANQIQDLNLKNSVNQANKRCTMRVSKLIGRSLTFSYNHDGMLDPMDLLDPELRPIPPQPGCEPSMQIYQDHRKMATDYLNVRNEINEMRQRKLELEETLKMSDEELLRSVIRNERSQHQGQLPSGPALHIQPDPAEVEQYLQLTTEKNNLVQLKEKLTTQLDMIKQAQIKQTQSRSGISQPSNVSNEPSKGGLAPKTTQDPRMVSAPSKDAESSTAKALSLSLAPSVAMTLGSGTIPPNVLTPPSNEQKVLLSQPQVPFARQISSNSDVGDSDTEWVVVKRAQTNPDDTKQT